MKRIILIITAVLTSLMSMTSCNDFQLNEHLDSISMLVAGGQYNKDDGTTRRAYMIINIEGLNEDDYTIEYTVDGHQGVGEYALQLIPIDQALKVYGSQTFKGSELLDETWFSGEYDGNFPSGSTTTFHYLYCGYHSHPSTGAAHFLSPKLAPGNHTINYTVTNSYGESRMRSKEFVIGNKQ